MSANTTDDELTGLAEGLFGPIRWRVIEPTEVTAAERALTELRHLFELPPTASPDMVVAAARNLHGQQLALRRQMQTLANIATEATR